MATILVLLVSLMTLTSCLKIDSIVTVKQGMVKGKVMQSRMGRKYVQFLGIPYASKPARFKPAAQPPTWQGVRDGTKFGQRCLQWDHELEDIAGSEDCLNVNVYTPVYSDSKQTRLPVMVFIHGYSFVKGSGNDYGPEYFMDEDVVLVTFNYRLGVFGFLTTLNKNLIPNLGMKDQVAALTWVHDNIQAFGGDDKRITIFGSGSGGASVSYHMLSPMSRGLFHFAISQSGNALCPWALVRNPLDVAIELGRLLNCSVANTFTIAACLKVVPVREIISRQQQMLTWSPQSVSFYPFGPVNESLEHSVETGPMFLTDTPKNLLREGRYQRVPWIIGVNSADGLTYSTAAILNSSRMINQVNRNWPKIAPLAFSYKLSAPNPAYVSKRIKEFYFKNGVNSETSDNFTQALSDGNFFRCTKNAALVYSQENPVWVYYFSHERNISILDNYGFDDVDFTGVPHSDELQYLFKMVVYPQISNRSRYFNFSTSFIRLWSSFASTGEPLSSWGNASKWEPLSRVEIKPNVAIKMLNIDSKMSIIEEPFLERMNFWDKLRLFPSQVSVSSVIDTRRNEEQTRRASDGTWSTRVCGVFVYILFLQNIIVFIEVSLLLQ